MCTLTSHTSNAERWAPRGCFAVLATVVSPSKSELQFWDLDFNAEDVGRKELRGEWGRGIQHFGMADHFGVTHVEDSCGRFLAARVCGSILSATFLIIDKSHIADVNWRNTYRTVSNRFCCVLVLYHCCLMISSVQFARICETTAISSKPKMQGRTLLLVRSSSLITDDWWTSGMLGVLGAEEKLRRPRKTLEMSSKDYLKK